MLTLAREFLGLPLAATLVDWLRWLLRLRHGALLALAHVDGGLSFSWQWLRKYLEVLL